MRETGLCTQPAHERRRLVDTCKLLQGSGGAEDVHSDGAEGERRGD